MSTRTTGTSPRSIESRLHISTRRLARIGGAAAIAIAVLAPPSSTLAQDKAGAPAKPASSAATKPAPATTTRPGQAPPAKPGQAPSTKPGQIPPTKPGQAPSAKPAAGAPAGNAFVIPTFRSVSALWSDGADVLLVAGDNHVVRLERNGGSIKGQAPERACCVAGRGTGASAEIAVVGTRGGVARFRGGAWDYGLAPALDGEDLRGVAFDAAGRLHAAGQRRALYIAEGNTWTLRRYPPGMANVVAIASAPDGTIYVVSSAGRVLTYASGVFRDLSIAGLTADMQAADWRGAWLSVTSKTLWIASKRHIIGIDLARNTATMHEIPLFFGADVFTGTRTASADLIVVGNMKDYGLFDGTGFYQVTGEGSFASAMCIDTKEATLITADSQQTYSFPLKHDALGTGPGEPIVGR